MLIHRVSRSNCPLASAKRRHDAHAGDDDDRPAEFIAGADMISPVDAAP